MITSFSTFALKLVSSVAAGMPSLILKVVLTVISTFYFSLDFERIVGFFRALLPKKAVSFLGFGYSKVDRGCFLCPYA